MSLPGAAAWLALLIEYLIKTTLALSLGLLLVVIARRHTAAIRHFLLSCFLIGLLLLPAASAFRIGWETDLLPACAPATVNQGARGMASAFASGFAGTGRIPLPPLAGNPDATPQPGALAPSAPASSGRLRILGYVLALVWSAGLAILILKLGLGILGAYRLTCESSEVADPVWRILLTRLLAVIRIRRTVRLKCHRAISIPITWGLLHPVILIPACHEEWTEDQRSSALLHELCHIKRADLLFMFLVRLSLAMFWFNPLCWIVLRRLKQEQERACDEMVLTAGVRPSTYAATLLFFKHATGLRAGAPSAFLGLVGGASFHQRLAAILRQKLTLKEVTMKTKVALAIAVMLAVTLIGMARPSKAVSESASSSGSHRVIQPQPANPDASLPASTASRADQNPKVDVQKEPNKKKDEQKRTIVITNQQGEKIPIEVTVVTGDTARKIVATKPLTIKSGKDGDLRLLDSEGKEIEVLKVEPLRLKIEGKELTAVTEGGLLKVDEAGKLSLIAEPDAAGAVRVQAIPRVRLLKSEDAKKIDIHILKKGEDGRYLVGTMGQDKVIVLKEKLKELQEELGKDKRIVIELSEAQRAIEKLEAKLATQEGGKNLVLRLVQTPKTLTVVKPQERIVAGTRIRIIKGAGANIAADMPGKGAYVTIVFEIKPGESSREVYDRIVARVKQELPAGYAVEPEYTEKSGVVALKITGAEMQKKEVTDFLKKIVAVIAAEIK